MLDGSFLSFSALYLGGLPLCLFFQWIFAITCPFASLLMMFGGEGGRPLGMRTENGERIYATKRFEHGF
jgi:hypothetical protein